MKRTVVLDPVLQSSSGRQLFPTAALPVFHNELLPYVDWITPNWAELAVLSEHSVHCIEDAENAARKLLCQYPGLHVAATGGDQREPNDLLLWHDGSLVALPGRRVETISTHGTGCAFSSALLCAQMLGATPVEAVRHAKVFVEQALRSAPGLGHGKGPMGLLWPLSATLEQR